MFLVDGISKSGAGLPTLARVVVFSVAVAVAVDIMINYLLEYIYYSYGLLLRRRPPFTLILSRAVGTNAAQSKFQKFRFEVRQRSRTLHEIRRVLHIDIDELAARGTDRVVVAVRHPVEPARPVAELNLSNVPRILQEAQAVITSRN